MKRAKRWEIQQYQKLLNRSEQMALWAMQCLPQPLSSAGAWGQQPGTDNREVSGCGCAPATLYLQGAAGWILPASCHWPHPELEERASQPHSTLSQDFRSADAMTGTGSVFTFSVHHRRQVISKPFFFLHSGRFTQTEHIHVTSTQITKQNHHQPPGAPRCLRYIFVPRCSCSSFNAIAVQGSTVWQYHRETTPQWCSAWAPTALLGQGPEL